MTRPRLILVGGFLGAGKTTLLLAAARRLAERGLRVGLVTNDQGAELVDTALAQDHDLPVSEVAGGCFCCRFPDLIQALQRLHTTAAPDVILAEPVGSCTDLAATVLRPLARDHDQQYTLAPLTIVVGADRNVADFSAQVGYLYERQTAEAELLLLNKCDLLPPDDQQVRVRQLAAAYPAAQVLPLAARYATGLDAWLETVMTQTSRHAIPLALDYQRYAEAEAELGWFNARGDLAAPAPVRLAEWAERVLRGLASDLQANALPIAHVKLYVTGGQHRAKASLTETQAALSWDIHPDSAQATNLQWVLNARVAADPTHLEAMVRRQLVNQMHAYAAQCQITHLECFRPAPPSPTHRITLYPTGE